MRTTWISRALLAGASVFAFIAAHGEAGAATWTFAYTGAEVTWTVPVTNYYDLNLYGGQGGSGGGNAGGRGAGVTGELVLMGGAVLTIIVGGQGSPGGSGSGGGGGGSFVFYGVLPLAVAGGGGGGSADGNGAGAVYGANGGGGYNGGGGGTGGRAARYC